ncbi:AEC family transporter [Rhizobacter sp. Root1221]|uniref:AEC family transporter n=1 Tax=Rhizobacter sp. Root1221 TaxID=1736433 RepID=UPI0007004DC8|nr:AEC family transporter [Rhizobacter sp. Root1221]KQV99762.1 transporter [Rhizobacter sp. Root1221]
MSSILPVTLPFFALVFCGYAAAWRGFLPESAIPGLNAFVLFFALPCLLFRFGASMPFAQLIDPALLGIYAVCALVVVAGTVAATRRQVGLKDAAFGGLVAAFPNTGFMGVPLLVALFGERAAGPVITTVLVDLALTSSLCIAIAESGSGTHHPTGPSPLARALRGAFSNPLPWAIALGAVKAASGLQLPGPVDQVIRMLADAASPVALFTIGAVLWRAGRHAHTRTPPAHFLPVAAVKLFLHPLLVLGAGLAARAAGFDVPAYGLTVLVLASALPSASNVSMLAERHGADNGRVARIIMATTVLSFATFSGFAALMRQ